MIRVMFVCHGNICRSPMAEFIMKKLVSDAGYNDEFYIASSATSTEELGNPVYPPAREELKTKDYIQNYLLKKIIYAQKWQEVYS